MFDLLKKERVFSVKNEHLTLFTNPSSHPAEAEFLFLLTRANNFDLSFFNLKTLQDYLLELERSRIPKRVLEEFVQKTKTKLTANIARKLFPLSEKQVESFVDRCKINNCPNAHRELGKCASEVHELQKTYNVQVDESRNWQYQQSKSKAEPMSFPADVVGEAIQMTQDHNILRMLGNQYCLELNDQNECSHATPESQHTVQLMQVITKLFMDAPQGTIEDDSSASTMLEFWSKITHVFTTFTQAKNHLSFTR